MKNRYNPFKLFLFPKKIILASALFFCLFIDGLFAQQVQDDFEGNGTISSWVADDIQVNSNSTNPYQQGINTSSNVLEYIDYGGSYSNVRFNTSTNLELFDNKSFSFKIYVASTSLTGTELNQVSLKLQNSFEQEPWITQTEIIKPILLDQWQVVTFNFETDNYLNFDPNSLPPIERFDFNRVLIQVNGENNNSELTAYIDDFYYDGILSSIPEFNDLVWSDEFDNDGAINSNLWHHQTQMPSIGSWYNGEVQHYTDRVDNAIVESSILKIVAKKENYTDQGITKEYTSARLNSKFAFQYGRVEIRAKMPSGLGTWPALWMLGKNIYEDGAYWDNMGFATTGWPACGEIDIMEHWGNNQNFVQSATHTSSSSGATVNHGGQYIPTTSSDFHIYTLIWNEDKLVFSVDDNVHYIYYPQIKNQNTWPFDAEQYLLLNFAVQANIDPNFTEDALEIDYVRVYQNDTVTIDTTSIDTTMTSIQNDGIASKLTLFPNPTNNRVNIDFKQKVEKAIFRVFDVTGKEVNQIQVNNVSSTSIDLGQSKGAYFIEVLIEGRKSYYKVLKN